LRLLLEAAQDRGDQRRGAGFDLLIADAELARDRFESARLGEDVHDLHPTMVPA